MSLLDTDIVLKKSNAHPTDDSSTAGGTKSSTVITNATVGEWFTRLRTPLTGDLDDDSIKEYQKVFVDNESTTDDLLDASIYLLNGIKIPDTAGPVKFVSQSPDDDSSKKIWAYGENQLGNVLDKEAVVLAAESDATGGKNWVRLFRCKLVNASTGALATADEDILIYVDDVLRGMIPKNYSFATSELRIWLPATTDDSSTSTNRLTPPSGATFVRAYDATSALSVRNDPDDDTLEHEQGQPVWGEFELQPGMEPFNGIDLVLRASGSGT